MEYLPFIQKDDGVNIKSVTTKSKHRINCLLGLKKLMEFTPFKFIYPI